VALGYSQTIAFEPYTLKTFDGRQVESDLGRLHVPEKQGGTKRIQIAFLRLKSKLPNPGPPVVFLMGGAGRGIVMGQIPVYYRLFEKLRDFGDVLLPDQRGIGMAVPDFESLCTPGPEPPSDVLSSSLRLLDVQLALVRRCVGEVKAAGVDLTAYTVTNRAEDLDQLRQALHADRLILLAWSAGTEVALETIRRYPARIAAAVLADTVGPDDVLTLPSTADLHLRKLSAMVAMDRNYIGAPDLFETARALLDRVDRTPLVFTVADPKTNHSRQVTVGRIALQSAIQADAGDGRFLGGLPAWLYPLAQGNQTVIQRKVEQMYDGLRSTSVLGLILGCQQGWTEDRLGRVRREARTAVLGTDNSPLPQACAMLELPAVRKELPPLFSNVRTLFVSGTLDAAAPPFQAEEVRYGFPNGSHLLVRNATHDVLVIGAVQEAIANFLKGDDVGGTISAAAPVFSPLPK
jgi:pimeloyl-ACP methyl ester carboxylesterase